MFLPKYLPGTFGALIPPYGPGGFIAANSGAWTLDATSLKAIPQTANEFSSQSFPTPTHIYRCQEASGNLADSVGANTLTVGGSPLYQQAIGGWTTKAVGANGGATNQSFTNAAMANTASVSVAFLVLAQINTPVTGGQRVFYGAASGNAWESLAGSGVMRLRNGANATNGALSHVGQVRPYLVVHDLTNSRNFIYSDQEKLSITYAAAAGTAFTLQCGIAADATSNTQILEAITWDGAPAELLSVDANVKAMLQSMGWTVTGY